MGKVVEKVFNQAEANLHFLLRSGIARLRETRSISSRALATTSYDYGRQKAGRQLNNTPDTNSL